MNEIPAYEPTASFVVRAGDASSQWVNTCIFNSPNPNESVSGRCYRQYADRRRYRVGYRIINTVFFWQDDHCKEAYLRDLQRGDATRTWHDQNAHRLR